jgi:hypothetical protein
VITKILDHLGLPTRHLRSAPVLRNPASLGYRSKPSLAWAFAARSQLTPTPLAVQPSHPGLSFAA